MKKRVLVWLTLGNRVGRDVFRGIYQYARLHSPQWDITHIERIQNELDTVLSWEFDGMIGPFNRQAAAEAAHSAHYPFCINLHGCKPFNRLPQVGTSDYDIGVVAADYFLNRRFENFGYFGHPGLRLSDERWEGYRHRLAAHGKTAVQLTAPENVWDQDRPPDYWDWVRPALKKWLLEQPRPFALFMENDACAGLLYDLCQQNNLIIPNDISLLGVNDEDIFCHNKNPPLSSIQVPSRLAGYRAAQMLDQLFKTRKPPKKPLFLKPGSVVERASTVLFNIPDPQLVKALRFITENAANRISVDQIARAAGLSRRVLEKRFRTHLNCSPYEEVRRAKIEIAKNALRETNLTIEQIAETVGMVSGNYLSQTFKKMVGQTPGSYRRNFR